MEREKEVKENFLEHPNSRLVVSERSRNVRSFITTTDGTEFLQ